MKIITIASLKGGVGKTSMAVFLAQSYTSLNKKVLCIDLDANNNTTDFFLRESDPEKIESRNVYHVLSGVESLTDCIYPIDLSLSVLPCTPDLHRSGMQLGTKPASIIRFANGLRKTEYDVIIIDTPPALVYELRVGLFVADQIVSPLQLSRWTFQNLQILRGEIEEAKDASGSGKKLTIVPSIVTDSEIESLREMGVDNLSVACINKAATVRNAGNKGKALKENSKSSDQFLELAKELL